MSKSDSSHLVPYWLEEKDWLCFVEYLPHFDEEARAVGIEAIGYYFGYAQLTDTRMLALLGDPMMPAYELLFSFSSEENKQMFLKLVQSNEFTETEPEMIMVPSAEEIRDARPLAMILDEDIVQHATMIAATLMMGTNSEKPN